MESDVEALLVNLGYTVRKRRNEAPPFDFICDFTRNPPDGTRGPSLQPPWFSPAGRVGFSVKEGIFRKKDAKHLKRDCSKARRSSNKLLNQISGGVLICNDIMLPSKLDEVLNQGIYCWDLRRLFFYAAKAHIVTSAAEPGHSIEYRFTLNEGGSCLLRSAGGLTLKAHIFYDVHDCNLGSNDVNDLLREANRVALVPARRAVPLPQSAVVSLHVLGIVDPILARDAYNNFRNDPSTHAGIIMPEASAFKVYQYRASPWSSMI